jgi:hypothetical protein
VENYVEWKTKFMNGLRNLKILDYLTADSPPHPDATWNLLDGQICQIIMESSSLDLVKQLEGLDTAKKIWKKILENFEKVTIARQRDAFESWCTCKMKEDETIEDYISRYRRLVEALDLTDCAIKESLKVIQLLRSLPESYHLLVASLIVHSDANLEPTLEHTYQKINTFSTFEQTSDDEQHSALHTSFGSRKPRTNPTPEQLRLHPCTYCNTFGHWWKDCPKKKADHDRNLQHPAANCTLPEDEYDDTHAAAATFSSPPSSRWIIDTGASYHITNHHSFTSYTPFQSPKLLYQGNGTTVQALGQGTVTLDVLVHDTVQPWELTQVFYVPNFKFNVLSPVLLRKSARMTLFEDKIEFTSPFSSKLLATATLSSGNLYLLQLFSFPTAYPWKPHPTWHKQHSLPNSKFRRRPILQRFCQFVTRPSSVLRPR